MNTNLFVAGIMCVTFFSISACKKDNDGTSGNDNKSGNANPDSGEPGPQTPSVDEGEGDHDGEGNDVPATFTVADLLQTAKKVTTRYERLAIPNSSLQLVKTWKSESYLWAKLTYKVGTDTASPTEEHLFLACHFHGAELGCHKKDESDPSEPEDTPAGDDLPTADDELPPIGEESLFFQ